MRQFRGTVTRVLIAVMLTGGLTLAATGLQAQAAVSVRPTLAVAPSVGAPGTEFGIRGIGFTCGGPVRLYFNDASPVVLSLLGSAKPIGMFGEVRSRGLVPRNAADGPARIIAVQGACHASAGFMVIDTYLGPSGGQAVEATAAGPVLPPTAA